MLLIHVWYNMYIQPFTKHEGHSERIETFRYTSTVKHKLLEIM